MAILQESNRNSRTAFIIKWVTSFISIAECTMTAFGLTQSNIQMFHVGLIRWFIVGGIWNDHSIMLIHVVALGAMIAGIVSTGT